MVEPASKAGPYCTCSTAGLELDEQCSHSAMIDVHRAAEESCALLGSDIGTYSTELA